MRSKPTGETARPVLDLVVESGLDTGWKKDLTGGPHLSATQVAGPACQRPQRRGEARGCWAAPQWAEEAPGPRGRRKRKGRREQAAGEGGGD